MFSPAHNYNDPFEIQDPLLDEEGNIIYHPDHIPSNCDLPF
jgi:hypothetical protein